MRLIPLLAAILLGALFVIWTNGGLYWGDRPIMAPPPPPPGTITRADPRLQRALSCTVEQIRAQDFDESWWDRAAAQFGDGPEPAADLLARAEAGETEAMIMIAFVFVDRDDARAVAWMEQAAALNDPVALNELGFGYHNGDYGLPTDKALAAEYYRRAMAAGDSVAGFGLGHLYEDGDIPAPAGQTRQDAMMDAFLHSAERCYADTLLELADRLALGQGVARDPRAGAALTDRVFQARAGGA